MKRNIFTMKIQLSLIVLTVGLTTLTGAGCKNTINVVDNSDPQNTSYLINGESFNLKNGKSEQQLPARPVTIKTSIFETTKADVNDDGKEDAIVILTQDTGGSGTFYYAAVAVNSEYAEYAGSNAVLLGDRIAPQTVRINEGIIEVNYATRNSNENFTVPPSVGVTKRLIYINGQLDELISNQEIQQKIIQLLSQNLNTSASNLVVNFESILNKFAKGTINFTNHGGAVWFAANTLKGWELAYVGNGIASCINMDNYDFPKKFAPKCLDSQNNVIDRVDPYISWEEAKKLIQNCKVKSVMQSHSLNVSLELKNGTRLKSTEPKIDDIIHLSVESEPNCGKIIMATE